jgi:hypothetical protein
MISMPMCLMFCISYTFVTLILTLLAVILFCAWQECLHCQWRSSLQ